MLLLAEGPLIVCDELRPGRASGRLGGRALVAPHQYAPQEGGNWFDAPGPRNLLVWLSPAPGRTLGMQTTQLWSGVRPFTVFAKQALKADQPVRFVSLLVPHEATTGADRAGPWNPTQRVVTTTPSRSTFRRHRAVFDVRIGRQGDWTVRAAQNRLANQDRTA